MIDTPRKSGSGYPPEDNKQSNIPAGSFFDESDAADNQTAGSAEETDYVPEQDEDYSEPYEASDANTSPYDENAETEESYEEQYETPDDSQDQPEEEQEYQEEALEEPIHQKRSFFSEHFNLIVGGGIALVIGIFLYFQLSPFLFKSSPSPVAPPPMPALNTALQGTPAQPDTSQPTIPQSGIPAAVPSQTPPLGVIPEPPTPNVADGRPFLSGPAEPSTPPEGAFQTPPPQSADHQTALPPSTPATVEAPAQDTETLPDSPLSPTEQAVGQSPLPEAAIGSDIQSRLDMLEAQLGETTSQLVQLQSSLDAVKQSVDQLSTAMPTATAAPSADMTEKVNQLQSTLDQLQQKVASLETRPAQRSSPTASAPKASQQKAASATPTPALTSRTAPRWVIRSATTGQAWVALEDRGIRRRVMPGDVLTGIGQIQTIRQVNGRWIIEGTEGKIQ